MKKTVIERDVSCFAEKCEKLISEGFRMTDLRVMNPKQLNEGNPAKDKNGEKIVLENIFFAEFEK